jgi:dTDP-4-dehydrorhamnose 3,5-epimerase
MKILPTTLPGLVLLELDGFADARGRFVELFRRERYAEAGVAVGLEFVQDNFSSSARGVVRGLHYQLRQPQGKLVCVTRGEVFDVAVDVRPASPSCGRWFGTVLSAENRRQLWVPPGFAHGFYVLGAEADFLYKCTAAYAPADERTIVWNDPDLAIAWPLAGEPIASAKDAAGMSWQAARAELT